jgi:hypothetical protein
MIFLLPAAIDAVVSQNSNLGSRVGVDLASELAVAQSDLTHSGSDLGVGVKRFGAGHLVGDLDLLHNNSSIVRKN